MSVAGIALTRAPAPRLGSGVETPAEAPALYKVLKTQKASVGGALYGSSHTYAMPGQEGGGGDVQVALDPAELEGLDEEALARKYEEQMQVRARARRCVGLWEEEWGSSPHPRPWTAEASCRRRQRRERLPAGSSPRGAQEAAAARGGRGRAAEAVALLAVGPCRAAPRVLGSTRGATSWSCSSGRLLALRRTGGRAHADELARDEDEPEPVEDAGQRAAEQLKDEDRVLGRGQGVAGGGVDGEDGEVEPRAVHEAAEHEEGGEGVAPEPVRDRIPCAEPLWRGGRSVEVGRESVGVGCWVTIPTLKLRAIVLSSSPRKKNWYGNSVRKWSASTKAGPMMRWCTSACASKASLQLRMARVSARKYPAEKAGKMGNQESPSASKPCLERAGACGTRRPRRGGGASSWTYTMRRTLALSHGFTS